MFLVARVLVVLLPAACLAIFDLTVLHTNDVHARFEQFNEYGSSCKDEDSLNGKCFGGVARRVTKVREIRAQEDNVVLLDGGDQFQGTMWFFLYKGVATSHFMNAIGYDVMTLGNHEFDNGPAGLEQFLRDINTSVVSCNIDATQEPSIDGLFTKSTVLTIGGEKVGIVGYTFARTPEISTTEKLVFTDEIPAIQAEVDRLVAEENINKIIALGHAGYNMDLKIAKEVQGVDIVVGGHSNTFLYTGTPPASEPPQGDYPTVVQPDSDSSGNVLVVQDYTLAKYLGRLDVTFDDSGKLTGWEGNPILLDSNVEEDPGVLEEIEAWGEEVRNISREYIGMTNVHMDHNYCRLKECNLGNMLTDAYIRYGTHPLVNGTRVNDITIAMFHAGGIRAALTAGDVTVGDITSVLPFGNTVNTVTIKGMYLLEALEHSVARYSDVEPPGDFFQVSGLLVTFDLSKSPGSRVAKVEVRCSICHVPDFAPLDPNEVYKVLLNSFTVKGGDGYTMIRDNLIENVSGNLDATVVTDYIKRSTPITAGLERRITFVENDDNLCSDGSTSRGRRETDVSALFSVLIIAFLPHFIFR